MSEVHERAFKEGWNAALEMFIQELRMKSYSVDLCGETICKVVPSILRDAEGLIDGG